MKLTQYIKEKLFRWGDLGLKNDPKSFLSWKDEENKFS
jgi:hypothetical protein